MTCMQTYSYSILQSKVGKDKMWPLEHNSEICFAGLYKKVFLFMSIEATSYSFPPELTTKYTVSKMLKKGACREVRLGFMVPTLHRVATKIIRKHTIVTTFNGGEPPVHHKPGGCD